MTRLLLINNRLNEERKFTWFETYSIAFGGSTVLAEAIRSTYQGTIPLNELIEDVSL